MLTRPEISDAAIVTTLRESFSLEVTRVEFLPLGADAGSAAFGIVAESGVRYFLKLRRGHGTVGAKVSASLRARGVRRVMAPLATGAGDYWARAVDFDWLLYPFFAGQDGYDSPLGREQWTALGETIRAVHAATLPAALATSVPRESFGSTLRDAAREHDRRIERQVDDPIAARLARFWLARRGEIRLIVDRAERLAAALRTRAIPFVLCHADLHGANVLVGPAGDLTVVDWDEVVYAPRERDLMSVGGGLFGGGSPPDEEAWFFEGYGTIYVDPAALAYYRYERIVADIAAFADQILGGQGSAEDREQGLGYLMASFEPGEVVDLAHGSFAGDPTIYR